MPDDEDETFARPPEKPTGVRPNKLREARDECIDAMKALIVEAKTHGAGDRARILKEIAVGLAALETSQAAWIAARTQMEQRR